MLSKVKKAISLNIGNILGWNTNRKIVVIESDDWGSIRMPSIQVYNSLLKNSIRVDKDPYCRYDTLATREDLDSLFNLLTSFKDMSGNHPIITANAIMANPYFKKIEESNFESYFFEPFTETLMRYPGCETSYELWKDGIEACIFHPQLHGREHLNINQWLSHLQANNKEMRFAFSKKLFCLSNITCGSLKNGFTTAFSSNNKQVISSFDEIIKDAINLFKLYFNYTSDSFIAPNYAWGDEVENVTSNLGIKFLQGNFTQYNTKTKRAKYNYLGKVNKLGQIYLMRNCFFEPSLDKNNDWVVSCIKEIKSSFSYRKPAVISSHRLNYVSGLDLENRDKNLFMLNFLFQKIITLWPDVEFMDSSKLGELIKNDIRQTPV